MNPTGIEISVHFYPNKIGHWLIGIFFTVFLVFLFYVTWLEPYESPSGRYPLIHYVTKFLGIPAFTFFCFYSFKTALGSRKVVELRVGVEGIWRRALTGSEIFIPWHEIQRITIENNQSGKLLIFHVTNLEYYPSLLIGYHGVNLAEGSSPVPLEELAQKFSRFIPFQDRYKATLARQSEAVRNSQSK